MPKDDLDIEVAVLMNGTLTDRHQMDAFDGLFIMWDAQDADRGVLKIINNDLPKTPAIEKKFLHIEEIEAEMPLWLRNGRITAPRRGQ